MPSFKHLMLETPSAHLDPALLPIIARWNDEPTAIQILELLDACIYGGAASEFLVRTLQTLLTKAMKSEGVTLEQLLPLATWRKD